MNLFALILLAAIPLHLPVDISRPTSPAFPAYHGESLEIEAELKDRGTAFNSVLTSPQLYYQTPGMGNNWWTLPATQTNNLLRATFPASADPGEDRLICFLGSAGENFRASFILNFRHAPGAVPNTVELPVPTLDFSQITVLNPPYVSTDTYTNTTAALEAGIEAVSNAVVSARTDLSAAIAAATPADYDTVKGQVSTNAADIAALEVGKQDAISDLETIRAGAALGATALQSYTETDPTVPSWAKADTKPSYTLNEVAPNSENWLGVQGNAGRTIKILAQGAGSSPAGGIQVTASTLNNNNTTTYAYSGVAVKRNGTNTDYLWDTTSASGIVRRSELATALAAKYEKPSTGIPKTDLASDVQNLIDGALQKVLPSGSTTIVLPYDDDVKSHFIIKDSAHNPVIDIASMNDDDDYEININGAILLDFGDIYNEEFGQTRSLAYKLDFATEKAVLQIAPNFTAESYALNDLCSYNGVVYRCKSAYTATAQSAKPNADTTHWEAKKVSELFVPWVAGDIWLDSSKCVSVGGEDAGSTKYKYGEIDHDSGNIVKIPSKSGTLALLQNLAPDFSTSATYAVGQLCVYNTKLYRCTTAITTAEAWTAAHWTEATVEDVLAVIRSALALKAPLASPAFTGTPTAPDIGTNTTSQVATKKYVDDAVAGCAPAGMQSVAVASGGTFGIGSLADGDTEFWRVSCAGAYTPASAWHLIGYGTWPESGSTFQCVVWRVASSYYCNVLVVEQ